MKASFCTIYGTLAIISVSEFWWDLYLSIILVVGFSSPHFNDFTKLHIFRVNGLWLIGFCAFMLLSMNIGKRLAMKNKLLMIDGVVGFGLYTCLSGTKPRFVPLGSALINFPHRYIVIFGWGIKERFDERRIGN